MKRARVMSTVAMAFFILSLFAMAVSETMRYVLLFDYGGSADYVTIVRDVLTFELPMLFGLIMAIIGVRLHARGRDRVIYPSGFLILMIAPVSLAVIGGFSGSSGGKTEYFAFWAAMAVGMLLVALDGFLCPRLRLMGIFGGALLLYSVTNLKKMNSGDSGALLLALGQMAKGSCYILLYIYQIAYVVGLTSLAIGALIYAVGRPAKSKSQ